VLALDELSAVRSPHFPGLLGQKNHVPPDLGVQMFDLALAAGPTITSVVFECSRRVLEKLLLLPGANLIWMP
jgi:hypothetical protein